MSKPLLSILIPTVVGRETDFDHLCEILSEQYSGTDVEIATIKDNKEITIGEKREKLYQMANGIFSIQVDDDDELAPDAIELIIKAIKENPDVDCITFEERCQMNGQLYCANHSLQYGGWEGDGSRLLSDGFHFHRTPFYKNVIKTSIAQSVPFEKIRFGEDHAWSIALYPHLKTEVHIPKQLYYYIHEPKDSFEERYGFNTK